MTDYNFKDGRIYEGGRNPGSGKNIGNVKDGRIYEGLVLLVPVRISEMLGMVRSMRDLVLLGVVRISVMLKVVMFILALVLLEQATKLERLVILQSTE